MLSQEGGAVQHASQAYMPWVEGHDEKTACPSRHDMCMYGRAWRRSCPPFAPPHPTSELGKDGGFIRVSVNYLLPDQVRNGAPPLEAEP